ncbi:hypothetical protein [Enterovibrio baiacu]|uniref:hypothetical protein n=1 Tax=Enterovibrio baiacu TaxID=2491023 RepID=UPI0010134B2B|nr:hypothetical protein [Enterovibrio baiacu]MBE1277708.1 hypothetical protein [Enterovibrio baiacu]
MPLPRIIKIKRLQQDVEIQKRMKSQQSLLEKRSSVDAELNDLKQHIPLLSDISSECYANPRLHELSLDQIDEVMTTINTLEAESSDLEKLIERSQERLRRERAIKESLKELESKVEQSLQPSVSSEQVDELVTQQAGMIQHGNS